MKLELLVAVPPGVVTLIGPVAANVGTVAVSDVDDSTLKSLALIPLNITAVAPAKFVPVMVTPVPTGPLVGVKLVIVGAGMSVKVAVMILLALMVTVQVPVPEHSPPLQSVKVEPVEAVAVNVTEVLLSKEAEQIAPQVMPPGLLVTVPLPAPVLLTLRFIKFV